MAIEIQFTNVNDGVIRYNDRAVHNLRLSKTSSIRDVLSRLSIATKKDTVRQEFDTEIRDLLNYDDSFIKSVGMIEGNVITLISR